MANGNGNSNTKILWWLISVLSGGLMGLGSHHFTGNAQHAERIAVLEKQLSTTEQRLERIEAKLDRALDPSAKR
jgi:hypothetical protein